VSIFVAVTHHVVPRNSVGVTHFLVGQHHVLQKQWTI